MDASDREMLMPLTSRLAELFASEDGALLLAGLQKAALLSRPPAPTQASRSLLLGVWEPEVGEDGAMDLVRSSATAGEWRYWADVERIATKGRSRVVLLGESVARGYLYDPCVTPASLLEGALGDVEVVDLARTDLGMDGLGALLDGLVALEPDVLVFFAGNNWHTFPLKLGELGRLATALRQGGYSACRRFFVDELLLPRAAALLDRLAESARELDAAVVLVVPEFNLDDWRPDPAALAPALAGDGNERWLEARRHAEEALAAGDYDDAKAHAAEMLALDGGTSPATHALLAAADPDDARRHREAARDVVLGTLLAQSPRCPSEVQELLRRKATEHGFAAVDLPRVFERALGGGIPGRTLFLDYCHLTLEGMRIAVAEIAERVADRLGTSLPDADLPAPDPADEALAHLMAAVHNAHYGQADEILRHHCEQALDRWPGVADSMLALLECQTRFADGWLCAQFEELCAAPIVRRYLAPIELSGLERLADFRLAAAITDALEHAGVGARERAAAILREDHPNDEVDLLEPRYHAETFRALTGAALGPERAYHRATGLSSLFYLPRAEAGPVRLRLTCRTPRGGSVGVAMNGALAHTIDAGPSWRTFGLELSARQGLNRVRLDWPPAPAAAGEIERAARRLERGVYPDVLPALGEVHALRAESVV